MSHWAPPFGGERTCLGCRAQCDDVTISCPCCRRARARAEARAAELEAQARQLDQEARSLDPDVVPAQPSWSSLPPLPFAPEAMHVLDETPPIKGPQGTAGSGPALESLEDRMAAEASELDRIDPELDVVKLVSGFPVEVVRLQTRQLFRLLRILTRGAAPAIAQLDFTEDASAFGAKLLGILIVAIPDAEQETIGFLQSMCQPAGQVKKKPQHLTKQDSEHNQELWNRFNEELFNPEIEDTLSLLEVIVANEAPELQALGKKLTALWNVAKKATGLGQPEEPPAAQDLHLPSSEEPTPSSSTSSATSTGGTTSESSTSPSAGSGSARKRRAAAGS